MNILNVNSEHEENAMLFQCPMKCEGDKVYSHPGSCPVCHMNLIPINGNNPNKILEPDADKSENIIQEQHKNTVTALALKFQRQTWEIN